MGQNGQKQQQQLASDPGSDSFLASVCGFEVVRLLPHSPAYDAGLVPYFDFIVGMDGALFSEKPTTAAASSSSGSGGIGVTNAKNQGNTSSAAAAAATLDPTALFTAFKARLRESKDRTLTLLVFNLRVRVVREVTLRPHTEWVERLGPHRLSVGGGLLGCSLEWACALDSAKACFRIQAVMEGSPAAQCDDIHEGRDFVIGVQAAQDTSGAPVASLLKSPEDFTRRIAHWQTVQRQKQQQQQQGEGGAPPPPATTTTATATATGEEPPPGSILLLLFDSESCEVREALLRLPRIDVPLGMQLASGQLHRVPVAPWRPELPQRLDEALPQMTQFVMDAGAAAGPLRLPRVTGERPGMRYWPYPTAGTPAAPSASAPATAAPPYPRHPLAQQQQQQPSPASPSTTATSVTATVPTVTSTSTSTGAAVTEPVRVEEVPPQPPAFPLLNPFEEGPPHRTLAAETPSRVPTAAATSTSNPFAASDTSVTAAAAEEGKEEHRTPAHDGLSHRHSPLQAGTGGSASASAFAPVVTPYSQLEAATPQPYPPRAAPPSSSPLPAADDYTPVTRTSNMGHTTSAGGPPVAAWEPPAPAASPAAPAPPVQPPTVASDEAAVKSWIASSSPPPTANANPISASSNSVSAASRAVPAPLPFPSFREVLLSTPHKTREK